MRADADHPSVVEDDDAVGVDDGADALRDDEHGGVRGFALERGAQLRVGREVERREAVVEDVDVRLADDRARNRRAAASVRRRG